MKRLKDFKKFSINENRNDKLYTNKNINIGDIYDESDIYNYVSRLHNEDDFIDGDLGDRIEKYPNYKVMEISLDKINTDEYMLDDDLVDDYLELYKKTDIYPPIVLGKLEYGKYNIIDGTQRSNALIKNGNEKIIAFVGLKKHQI